MFSPENCQTLILEPDATLRRRAVECLTSLGYPVLACRTRREARAAIADREFDLACIALGDGVDGARETLDALHEVRPGLACVVLCRPDQARKAASLIGSGADDYLLHPPDRAEARQRLLRLFRARDVDSTMALLRDELERKTREREIVGESRAMRSVIERARRIAPMRSTVLIQGESGTGKELVARLVHTSSPRRSQPFVALNCAAIPDSLIESELFGHERGAFTGAVARVPGKFEIAHRGTLFLDEIGEMNRAAQVRLLRVLEEQEFMRVGGSRAIRVDVRVIAATNADLDEMVSGARFRQDLYFRLKVVTLALPPLRERREDITPLVRLFVDQIGRANDLHPRRVAPEALEALRGYDWPGNVRELHNLLENLLVSTRGDELRLEDLPPALRTAGAGPPTLPEIRPGQTIDELEREAIRRTLASVRGHRQRAARMLGIGVRTLQRKIRRYSLASPGPRQTR